MGLYARLGHQVSNVIRTNRDAREDILVRTGKRYRILIGSSYVNTEILLVRLSSVES